MTRLRRSISVRSTSLGLIDRSSLYLPCMDCIWLEEKHLAGWHGSEVYSTGGIKPPPRVLRLAPPCPCPRVMYNHYALLHPEHVDR